MNSDIIARIKSKMQDSLLPSQMLRLEGVLEEVLSEGGGGGSAESCPENSELLEHFIEAKAIEGCSKRTEAYYRSIISHFEKSMKKNVRLITTGEIREYLLGYQTSHKCGNVTLDTMRRILSSFFAWLEEENFIIKSPMKRIHKIKTPRVIKPALSDEQVERIREAASKSRRNLAMIDFLISSGVRVSELVRIDRESVNMDSRSCVVTGKGAKQREVYFDVRTKIELENYLSTRSDGDRALFVSARKRRDGRISVSLVEKIVREIGRASEIEGVHPHRFRRTMATRAIDRGMPIEQVQVLLGHTQIDTTLRYANVRQTNVMHSHQKYVC